MSKVLTLPKKIVRNPLINGTNGLNGTKGLVPKMKTSNRDAKVFRLQSRWETIKISFPWCENRREQRWARASFFSIALLVIPQFLGFAAFSLSRFDFGLLAISAKAR